MALYIPSTAVTISGGTTASAKEGVDHRIQPPVGAPSNADRLLLEAQFLAALPLKELDMGPLRQLFKRVEQGESIRPAVVKDTGYFNRFFSKETWSEWVENRTELGKVVDAYANFVDNPARGVETYLREINGATLTQAIKQAKTELNRPSKPPAPSLWDRVASVYSGALNGLDRWRVRAMDLSLESFKNSHGKYFDEAATGPRVVEDLCHGRLHRLATLISRDGAVQPNAFAAARIAASSNVWQELRANGSTDLQAFLKGLGPVLRELGPERSSLLFESLLADACDTKAGPLMRKMFAATLLVQDLEQTGRSFGALLQEEPLAILRAITGRPMEPQVPQASKGRQCLSSEDVTLVRALKGDSEAIPLAAMDMLIFHHDLANAAASSLAGISPSGLIDIRKGNGTTSVHGRAFVHTALYRLAEMVRLYGEGAQDLEHRAYLDVCEARALQDNPCPPPCYRQELSPPSVQDICELPGDGALGAASCRPVDQQAPFTPSDVELLASRLQRKTFSRLSVPLRRALDAAFDAYAAYQGGCKGADVTKEQLLSLYEKGAMARRIIEGKIDTQAVLNLLEAFRTTIQSRAEGGKRYASFGHVVAETLIRDTALYGAEPTHEIYQALGLPVLATKSDSRELERPYPFDQERDIPLPWPRKCAHSPLFGGPDCVASGGMRSADWSNGDLHWLASTIDRHGKFNEIDFKRNHNKAQQSFLAQLPTHRLAKGLYDGIEIMLGNTPTVGLRRTGIVFNLLMSHAADLDSRLYIRQVLAADVLLRGTNYAYLERASLAGQISDTLRAIGRFGNVIAPPKETEGVEEQDAFYHTDLMMIEQALRGDPKAAALTAQLYSVFHRRLSADNVAQGYATPADLLVLDWGIALSPGEVTQDLSRSGKGLMRASLKYVVESMPSYKKRIVEWRAMSELPQTSILPKALRRPLEASFEAYSKQAKTNGDRLVERGLLASNLFTLERSVPAVGELLENCRKYLSSSKAQSTTYGSFGEVVVAMLTDQMKAVGVEMS